jgi:multicomponent Na+:H+ antiporter subunit D
VINSLPALLFFVPFVAALVVTALAPFAPRSARPIGILALAASAAAAVSGWRHVLAEGTLRTSLGGWSAPLGIELVLDPLSALMAVLVLGTAAIVLASTADCLRTEFAGREPFFVALALLLVAGLTGIVVTGDLFNLFVHLEVASLSAYALVAAGERGAPRAGLRYLLIGSFGASLFLAGIGFIYGGTGTLNMMDVAERIGTADPRLVRVGGLLMVTGLAVKMGLYPLHLWMPSAYARGPIASAALMAPLVTKVSAYALLRVLFWTFGIGLSVGDLPLAEATAWLGAAAVVAGGAMAFVQTDLRRLLAYSSVGQIGIVALGIGLADVPGLTGAVMHLASDAVVKAALFLAAGAIALHLGITEVAELHRLRGRAPVTSAVLAIGGLSIVGIPPLAGFFGKWYVLNAALAEGRWAFVAALVFGSLASIGYVFRMIERLYFVPSPLVADDPSHEGRGGLVIASAVFIVGTIALGLGNAWLVEHAVLPALPMAVLP